jgi:hypothetical protein
MTKARRLALAMAMLCGDAHAAGACSGEEAVNARAAAVAARDWDALYDVFHRFGHCETPAVSEAFSASIGHMLAARWNELHDLEHFAEANRGFRAFVAVHVDATIPEPDLRRMVSNASECPSHARPICREIGSRARAALRDKEKAG